MVTVILICTPLGVESNIPQIKEEIIKYIGVRMVKENPIEKPNITLNEYLSQFDQMEVSKIVSNVLDTAGIFFIESEDEAWLDGNSNYRVLNPKK